MKLKTSKKRATELNKSNQQEKKQPAVKIGGGKKHTQNTQKANIDSSIPNYTEGQ